jgi:hypothetical protein
MSQSLANQPFLPGGVAFTDPKSGQLAPAGSQFLRTLWMRTGSATGGIPASQLPVGVATVTFVTSSIEAAVSGLAPLASPALTGTPTAPTQATSDNSTKVATTAYVKADVTAATAGLAPLASPTFTGTPSSPTASPGTSTTQIATTAFVAAADALLAPLASPTFTGAPAAPTPTTSDSTTKIATTEFVKAQGYQTAANVAAAIAALPIVKSGSVSLGSVAAGGTGTGSVTFPTPFPNACDSVVVSASGSLLSTGGQPAALTGLTYDYTSTNSGAATYTLYWVAIGS